MKFVHLTDLHVVPAGGRLYGLDPNERLALAVADINAHHSDAEFVLVTGDLAHHGDPAAYAAVKHGLSGLMPPVRLMIGNHDDRAEFLQAFGERGFETGGFVQYAFDTPVGRFICLDTKRSGTHAGELCGARLDFLKRELEAANGRRVFIGMHHPPVRLGLPGMDAIPLLDEEPFWAVLSRHAPVAHIFCGHAHRPAHGAVRGIPFSLHRGLNHQVSLHFTEESGIPGSHEPPAYAVVRCTDTATIVHVHDFLDDSPRFDLFDLRAESASHPAELSEAQRVRSPNA